MTETVMTSALREAGLTIPQNKRIWLWLKDHPNFTASEIGAAVKVPASATGGYLRDMETRGMVKSAPATRRMRAGGRGKHVQLVERAVDVWAVNPKMDEFELWPKPKKAKAKDNKPVADGPVQTALVKPAAPPWTPEVAVEKLTLTQCRDLFNYLHKVFKE